MRSATYAHKIGSTLRLVGQVRLDGDAQDLSGWTLRCRAVSGCVSIDLSCRWVDAAYGALELHADAADQGAWRAGRYALDVRMESPTGEVLISSTAHLHLHEAITT